MKQQVALSYVHDDGRESRMVAMVDWRTMLKPGSTITLKDSTEPELRWTVIKAMLPDRVPPRGWNNNI